MHLQWTPGLISERLSVAQNRPRPVQICAAGSGQASPGLDDMKKRGFWTSVSDLLLMFPLTLPVRAVLLEMLCVGTQPSQVFAPPKATLRHPTVKGIHAPHSSALVSDTLAPCLAPKL